MNSLEKILTSLTPAQKQAVTHTDGPLLVLAGAGSGKTRVITRRVGYMIARGINPASIVAITFTNKAANEMLHRIDNLLEDNIHNRPLVSTFHSFCVKLLRQYGNHINLDSNFTIFDTSDRSKLIKSACSEIGSLPAGLTPAKVTNFISAAKTRLIGPDDLIDKTRLPEYLIPTVSRIYRKYEELLQTSNALDFDDLLIKALDLLDVDEAREKIHNRYHYFLIDEYQDTNRAQYLLAKRLSEHTRNICATGDPDQSIYAWRGADLNNILDFEKDFPDVKIVYLENNYRSTAYILQAANSLIRNNKRRKDKQLIAVRGQGTKLKIHRCFSETDEARQVLELIEKSRTQGRKLSEIAVFCRVNSLFRNIEPTLAEHQIPYQIVRGVSFFQRKEIKDLMAYLRVIFNPADTVALERIINTPTRGIGAQAQSALKAYAEIMHINLFQAIQQAQQIETLGKSQSNVLRFARMISHLRHFSVNVNSMEKLVKEILEQTTLLSYYERIGEKEKRPDELSPAANLMEFVSLAQKYDLEVENGHLEDFISQLSLVSDIDSVNDETESVLLMTMHAAKGLEFEHVIIIGAEDGIIPHNLSMDESRDIEEERRLFFVALTRAKQQIDICYAENRSTRGSYRANYPSRFLDEIDPRTIDGANIEEFKPKPRNNQFVISPRKPVQDAAAQANSRPRCEYRPGQRVYHKIFGHGIIQEIYLAGSNYIASVFFHNAGLKKLVVGIAPLQIIK